MSAAAPVEMLPFAVIVVLHEINPVSCTRTDPVPDVEISPSTVSIVDALMLRVSPTPSGVINPLALITRPPPPAGGVILGAVIATAALMLLRFNGSVTPPPPPPADGSMPFMRIFFDGSLCPMFTSFAPNVPPNERDEQLIVLLVCMYAVIFKININILIERYSVDDSKTGCCMFVFVLSELRSPSCECVTCYVREVDRIRRLLLVRLLGGHTGR